MKSGGDSRYDSENFESIDFRMELVSEDNSSIQRNDVRLIKYSVHGQIELGLCNMECEKFNKISR